MKMLPDISQDFSAWYQEIVYLAELVDESPVRGSIVIRPYGYAIWEHIKDDVDKRIKRTGHHNASFPLLIPESFLKKEAEHVEGFAPQLVVVTHAGGKQLEEALIVRPTSETIIHFMFARWIKSWRDLPLKINQWANVMRWELRPRPFLRTTEFFWQEGHTAHATKEEAHDEVLMMLNEYVELANDVLAIPVITGVKSDSERFPGAEKTYTFEGLMPDGKVLQMGTSHLLSQSFAHAFEMKFQDKNEQISYPYLTSWAITTRLVGAVVMVHGDQKGLVLPPKIAPIQVVITPIFKKDADTGAILAACETLSAQLKERGVRVMLDADDSKSPGAKFYHWEVRGVPVRIELGPKDLQAGHAMVVDRLGLGKEAVSLDTIADHVVQKLDFLQKEMYQRALKKRDSQWYHEAKLAQFGPQMDDRPGFYQTGWCGDAACEQELKQYKATTRCLLDKKTFKECFHCSNANKHDVLVAKSY